METIRQFGSGLKRPECVLAHSSGLLFAADWTQQGGVSVIDPSGNCHKLLVNSGSIAIRPNGIALEPGGTFLLAHLGNTTGGVFRLHANGEITSAVSTINGQPMPPSNYVVHDAKGRVWITVSTLVVPRSDDYRRAACTGIIAVAEPGASDARMVADNLGYTNECVIDLEQGALYVNETFGRRLTRFDLAEDGSLRNRHVVVEFGPGTYPDGVARDENGDFWITSIVSNRIIRVTGNGSQQIMFEDSDPEFLRQTESAYNDDSLGSEHLGVAKSSLLKNASSLAFGGHDRKTAYIGNLLDSTIYKYNSTVAGVALPHWDVPLDHLERFVEK